MSSSSLSEHDDASALEIRVFQEQLQHQIDHLRDLDLGQSPSTLDTSEICTSIEEQILYHEDEPVLSDLRNKVLRLEICSDLTQDICKLQSQLAFRQFTKSVVLVDEVLQIEKYKQIALKISERNLLELRREKFFIRNARNHILSALEEVPEMEAEVQTPDHAQQAEAQAEARQPEELEEPPPKRRRSDGVSLSEGLDVVRQSGQTAAPESGDRPRITVSRPAEVERIVPAMDLDLDQWETREIRPPQAFERQESPVDTLTNQQIPAELDSTVVLRRGSMVEPLSARYSGVPLPSSRDRPEGDGQVPEGREDISLPPREPVARESTGFLPSEVQELRRILEGDISLLPEPDATPIDGRGLLHPGEEEVRPEPEMPAQPAATMSIPSPAHLEPPAATEIPPRSAEQVEQIVLQLSEDRIREAEEDLGIARAVSPRIPEILPRPPSPRQPRSPQILLPGPDERETPAEAPSADDLTHQRIPTLAQLAAVAIQIPAEQVQEIVSEVRPEDVVIEVDEGLEIDRAVTPVRVAIEPPPEIAGSRIPEVLPIISRIPSPRQPRSPPLVPSRTPLPETEGRRVAGDDIIPAEDAQLVPELAVAGAVTPVQVTLEPPSEIAEPRIPEVLPIISRTPSPRQPRSPPLVPSRTPLPETEGRRADGDEIIPAEGAQLVLEAAVAERAVGDPEEPPNVEVVVEQRRRRVRPVFDENTYITNYASRALRLNESIVVERERVYQGPPTILQAAEARYLMRNMGFHSSIRERRIGDDINRLYTRHLITSERDYNVPIRRVTSEPRSPRQELPQRPDLEATQRPDADAVRAQISGARPSIVESEMLVERTGSQRAEPADPGLLRQVTPTVRRPTVPLGITGLPGEMPEIQRIPEPFVMDLPQERVDEMQRADLIQQEVVGGAERPLELVVGEALPREPPEIERAAVPIDIDVLQQAAQPIAEEMPRAQEVQREEPVTPITAELQRLFGTPVARLVQPQLEPPDLRNVPEHPPRTPRTLRLQGMPIEERDGQTWFVSTQRNAPEKRWSEFRYVQELLEEIWQEKEENNQPKSASVEEMLRRADSYNRENALTLIRIFDKLSLRNQLVLDFQNNNAIAYPFEPPCVTEVQMECIRKFENLDISEE